MDTSTREIKCLVWDLDDTLWDGVLLEDARVTLRDQALPVIQALDGRGILHSIASRNEHDLALAKLGEFGLSEYFLYPQIGWDAKTAAIQHIAERLNLGLDALAFIDDQPFERDAVAFSLPEVMCIDARDLPNLLALPALNPRLVSAEAKMRRALYRSDLERNRAESEFSGPQEAFLASLGLDLRIFRATAADLARCAELTQRTHQLNTTGYIYSQEELLDFSRSPTHLLLGVSLQDRYGSYGQIGVALIELEASAWTIKLLLMSCRVMSRGVGTVLVNQIACLAANHKARLRAEFLATERNRMMYMTYKFAHFKKIDEKNGIQILENDLARIAAPPDYLAVTVDL